MQMKGQVSSAVELTVLASLRVSLPAEIRRYINEESRPALGLQLEIYPQSSLMTFKKLFLEDELASDVSRQDFPVSHLADVILSVMHG